MNIQLEFDWDFFSDEEIIVFVGSKFVEEILDNGVVDLSLFVIIVDVIIFCVEEESDFREFGIIWLIRNVIVQYWCGQNRLEEIYLIENFKKDW